MPRPQFKSTAPHVRRTFPRVGGLALDSSDSSDSEPPAKKRATDVEHGRKLYDAGRKLARARAPPSRDDGRNLTQDGIPRACPQHPPGMESLWSSAVEPVPQQEGLPKDSACLCGLWAARKFAASPALREAKAAWESQARARSPSPPPPPPAAAARDQGRLVFEYGDPILRFGKFKGKRVSDIMLTVEGRRYLTWVEDSFDFDKNKRLLTAVIAQLDEYRENNKEIS